jgi:hypothetical protein
VGNCPNAEEAQARVGKLDTDRAKAFNAAMQELCPRDILASLFEQAVDAKDGSVFFSHDKGFLHSDRTLYSLSTFAGNLACPAFHLDGPERKSHRWALFKEGSEVFYAREYLGFLRPDIYFGGKFFLDTIRLFAESTAAHAKNIAVPAAQQPLLEGLSPWVAKVFERMTEELASPSDPLIMGAALCVFDRAQNRMNPHITHPSAQTMPAAMLWLSRAGFFHRINEGNCPAGPQVVKLMTMPLFAGSPREGMALNLFIKKAGTLIATSKFWRAEALKLSEILLHRVPRFTQEYDHYSRSATGAAMDRMRESLGDAPHLFVSPNPPLALYKKPRRLHGHVIR